LDRVRQLFEANQGEVDLKVRRGAQTLAMRLRLDHLM
jgi:hypothetical protein